MSPSALRAEYDRLAAACKSAKRDTPEWKQLMEAKRVAFIAWNEVKDQPEPVEVVTIMPPKLELKVNVPIVEDLPPSPLPDPEPDPHPRRRRGRRSRSDDE